MYDARSPVTLRRLAKQTLTPLVAGLLVLFSRSRSSRLIAPIRRLMGFQLSGPQVWAVCQAIWRRRAPNVLVFGVGFDSPLWQAVNRSGQTVFIENDPSWIAQIVGRNRSLNVVQVSYSTELRNWPHYAEAPDLIPTLGLPDTVCKRSWDVILVDAPLGYDPGHPGRMQSIASASQLLAPGATVFIHDCDRPAERALGDVFFGSRGTRMPVRSIGGDQGAMDCYGCS